MVKVRKNISITYEQHQFVKEHGINLSKFVRERLKELMEEENK